MKFYDTHCHLSTSPLLESIDCILKVCKDRGVIVNNIGTDVETSIKVIEQAQKYDNCFPVVGIHPSCVENPSKEIVQIKQLCLQYKPIAIGETGLDYHYPDFNKLNQIESFINHIKLSQQFNLPLVVHTRDAGNDTYQILKQNIIPGQKILIHCFSGTKEDLMNYLSIGCYISISGIITFKKSNELRELIKLIPIDKMLIETDSPYLSPEPLRGKDCLPYYVEHTFNKIHDILGGNKEKLQQKIFINSIIFFNIAYNE